MKLTRKALPVLSVLYKLSSHFGKLYCYPSQDKICELLQTFCSLPISRRQLNYDLLAICNHGLLRRVRRHKKTKHRGMEFHSTLYEISNLGYNLLVRSGVLSWGMLKGIQKRIQAALSPKKKPCAIKRKQPDMLNLASVLQTITGNIDTS